VDSLGSKTYTWGRAGVRTFLDCYDPADTDGIRFLMARKNANGFKPDKSGLPKKTCAACARVFTWRKKWARDWESVRYCSDTCRAAGVKS